MRTYVHAGLVAALAFPSVSWAQEPPALNAYVLRAVEKLATERSRGGYNLNKRFTRDLTYGGECCLPASSPKSPPKPNPTMCVAAVIEVMVEALNLYQQQTADASFKTKMPLSRWKTGNKTGVIPNVFMYAGTDSAGTAASLKRLGMGEERAFDKLAPGDFINLNRASGSGHSVVFLGYIKAGSATPIQTFSKDVVGFRYFSAQGKNRADGGFGYRNAYLVEKCPTPRGRDDDCNIVGLTVRANGTIQQSRRLLNSGRMYAPAAWSTTEALASIRKEVTRSFEEEGLTRDSGLEAAVQGDLAKELAPDLSKFVDGSEDGLQ